MQWGHRSAEQDSSCVSMEIYSWETEWNERRKTKILFLLRKLDFGSRYSLYVILYFYTKPCLLSDNQTQRFAGCYGRGPWQQYCLGMVDWRRGRLAQLDWVCFTALGFPLGTDCGVLWIMVSAVDSHSLWGERNCNLLVVWELWVSTFPWTDHCSLTTSNHRNHTYNRKSHDNQD